jgi:signal transduction histidine kinase
MKKTKNNTWLLILMIISQIMLSGLLVQWLKSQWIDEKEALQKEVSRLFTESVNQVMDSLLVKHLIVPVMNDTSAGRDHMIRFSKTIPEDSTLNKRHITAMFNSENLNREAVISIAIPDSPDTSQKENISFNFYDSTEKTFLLRSVKLIINQTGEPGGELRQLSHLGFMAPDTAMLKAVFENKIIKVVDGVQVRWISESERKTAKSGGTKIYIGSNLFEIPINAELTHFQSILLQGISAQIIFGLVLIILTGAAFFFTFRSLKKMELLNTLRNDFISNISHELKTPVSTVTIALEALKTYDRMKDPAKSEEYLSIAFNEMKRLDQLISQVLNTSILEDQSQYLKLEEGDLISLIREVLTSMQVRFRQNKASVEFNPFVETCILNIDRLHVQGVLINLLDNSLKYNDSSAKIRIEIKTKDGAVLLTVSDNGPGIPDEYISKVFDKFFRVPKGDRHDVKGYGLGLSFAELVMRHHSGSISVRNLVEGGCEFTLTFPKSEK